MPPPFEKENVLFRPLVMRKQAVAFRCKRPLHRYEVKQDAALVPQVMARICPSLFVTMSEGKGAYPNGSAYCCPSWIIHQSKCANAFPFSPSFC